MKYVTTERFIVSSNTADAQKKYADNYDAVFRHKESPEGDPEAPEECANSDGIECRVRGYLYECQTCKCLHMDPTGHQHHALYDPESP